MRPKLQHVTYKATSQIKPKAKQWRPHLVPTHQWGFHISSCLLKDSKCTQSLRRCPQKRCEWISIILRLTHSCYSFLPLPTLTSLAQYYPLKNMPPTCFLWGSTLLPWACWHIVSLRRPPPRCCGKHREGKWRRKPRCIGESPSMF